MCMRGAVVLLLSAFAAACSPESEGDDAGVDSVVRDSAGVRIVENGQVPPSAWRVRTSSLFTLGWGSGGPETDNRILAVRLDELDVPAVALLELLKG